jgi:hypothetical protein
MLARRAASKADPSRTIDQVGHPSERTQSSDALPAEALLAGGQPADLQSAGAFQSDTRRADRLAEEERPPALICTDTRSTDEAAVRRAAQMNSRSTELSLNAEPTRRQRSSSTPDRHDHVVRSAASGPSSRRTQPRSRHSFQRLASSMAAERVNRGVGETRHRLPLDRRRRTSGAHRQARPLRSHRHSDPTARPPPGIEAVGY